MDGTDDVWRVIFLLWCYRRVDVLRKGSVCLFKIKVVLSLVCQVSTKFLYWQLYYCSFLASVLGPCFASTANKETSVLTWSLNECTVLNTFIGVKATMTFIGAPEGVKGVKGVKVWFIFFWFRVRCVDEQWVDLCLPAHHQEGQSLRWWCHLRQLQGGGGASVGRPCPPLSGERPNSSIFWRFCWFFETWPQSP